MRGSTPTRREGATSARAVGGALVDGFVGRLAVRVLIGRSDCQIASLRAIRKFGARSWEPKLNAPCDAM